MPFLDWGLRMCLKHRATRLSSSRSGWGMVVPAQFTYSSLAANACWAACVRMGDQRARKRTATALRRMLGTALAFGCAPCEPKKFWICSPVGLACVVERCSCVLARELRSLCNAGTLYAIFSFSNWFEVQGQAERPNKIVGMMTASKSFKRSLKDTCRFRSESLCSLNFIQAIWLGCCKSTMAFSERVTRFFFA